MEICESALLSWLARKGYPVAPFFVAFNDKEVAAIEEKGPFRLKVEVGKWRQEEWFFENKEALLEKTALLWGTQIQTDAHLGVAVQQLLIQPLAFHLTRSLTHFSFRDPLPVTPFEVGEFMRQNDILELDLEWIEGPWIVGGRGRIDPDAIYRQRELKGLAHRFGQPMLELFAEQYGFKATAGKGKKVLVFALDQQLGLAACDLLAELGTRLAGLVTLPDSSFNTLYRALLLYQKARAVQLFFLFPPDATLSGAKNILRACLKAQLAVHTPLFVYCKGGGWQQASALFLKTPWRTAWFTDWQEAMVAVAKAEWQ